MAQCIDESPLERVQRIARRMRYIILFGIAFELSESRPSGWSNHGSWNICFPRSA